jgi:hypothetical protein
MVGRTDIQEEGDGRRGRVRENTKGLFYREENDPVDSAGI